MIMHLAVTTELRLVTDRQTDRHDVIGYRAGIVMRGNKPLVP